MSLNDAQAAVREFHIGFDLIVGDRPQLVPLEYTLLRIKNIKEELEELEEAARSGDTTEVYDAYLDILYYTLGGCVENGMEAEPGFDEVQRSNMSKFDENGKAIKSRGEALDGFPAGKVLKGPNYFKPDLARILSDQHHQANIREGLTID